MSSRMFQSVILQVRGATDRAVGVIDASGLVVACSDLAVVGQRRTAASLTLAEGEDLVHADGCVYKTLGSRGTGFDFAAFVSGDDDVGEATCKMAAVALGGAKTFYEEKHDKTALVRNILLDNILPEDVFTQAKELSLDAEKSRVVMLIHQTDGEDPNVRDVVRSMFPDENRNFVIHVGNADLALVREVNPDSEPEELTKSAEAVTTMLNTELMVKAVIGIGSVVTSVRDLAASYKEAQAAIDVGSVFDTEKTVVYYASLGIGRLIYQLPVTMCEMFLNEIFKKNTVEQLDNETLYTIQKFFENNLNVSETSRRLFVHRNTLVYRLEKIKKLTGLDLREFDHAIVFRVALMVRKYLASQPRLGLY